MKKQEYEQMSQRLNQIRREIELKGYSIEYDEVNGARLYKNDEFTINTELQPLVDEYAKLRLIVDEHTNDWDGSFKEN